MSFKDESSPGSLMGWLAGALVFSIGIMIVLFLLSKSLWHGSSSKEEDVTVMLRAANTRPLVIIPLPRN